MKYKNPIIRGFNPDPSVCRVGLFAQSDVRTGAKAEVTKLIIES